MKALSLAICGILLLSACVDTQTMYQKVHSTPTADLQRRRVELNRMIANDEFGAAWGVTRWVSHAVEERNVRKEKEAIDNELGSRQ